MNDLTKKEHPRNIVILDQTGFYPTSGGQECDKGKLIIKDIEYVVVNCEKVGNCVTHTLDKDLSEDIDIGVEVSGSIDVNYRNQLKAHHTATHIIFAASKQVLGPHVWQ